jgi:uncharacterized protein YjbI with pentapeptide repeats
LSVSAALSRTAEAGFAFDEATFFGITAFGVAAFGADFAAAFLGAAAFFTEAGFTEVGFTEADFLGAAAFEGAAAFDGVFLEAPVLDNTEVARDHSFHCIEAPNPTPEEIKYACGVAGLKFPAPAL